MKKVFYYFLSIHLFLILCFFLFTCSVFADDSKNAYFNLEIDTDGYYTYMSDLPNFQGSSLRYNIGYVYSNGYGWYSYDKMDFQKDAVYNGYFLTVNTTDTDVKYSYNNQFQVKLSVNGLYDHVDRKYDKGVVTFSLRAINLQKEIFVDEELINENPLDGAKVQLRNRVSNKYDDCMSMYYQESATLTVSCPFTGDHIYNAYYIDFRLTLDSRPFEGTRTPHQFGIFLQNQLFYSELEHSPLVISHTENNGDVTVTVNSKESGITGYDWSIENGTHGHVDSTGYATIPLGKLSNGQYEMFITALYNDESGTLTPYTFKVTNSSLPIADLRGDFSDNDLKLDGSYSRAIGDATITKYYFQIDDGQIYVSVSPYYNFLDLDYGTYTVKFWVEDSKGEISTSIIRRYSYLKPQDEYHTFLEDFFGGIGDAFVKVLIPSKEDLRNWFNTTKDLFESQMGFLAFPFTWTLNFLDRYLDLSDTGHYIIAWNDVRVPNFEDFVIIKAGSFDLASLLENPTLKSLHDLAFVVINALVILALFKYCTNILARIFGTDTNDYEYITVDDSVVVSNNGVTKSVKQSSSTRTGYRYTKKRRR